MRTTRRSRSRATQRVTRSPEGSDITKRSHGMHPERGVVDAPHGAVEAVRVPLRVEVRVERIAGHQLVHRRPGHLDEPARGRAELPDLAEVRPLDLDELRSVENARDALLLAAHGDLVTIRRRVDECGAVAAPRHGARTAAELVLAGRGGEQERHGEPCARAETEHRPNSNAVAACAHNAPGMTWWESWFGEEYLDLYPHRDRDSARREAAFAAARLSPRSTPMLDLCCGAGRHFPFFQELGIAPIGLDYSAPLLELARARTGAHAPRARRHALAPVLRRRVRLRRELLHELRIFRRRTGQRRGRLGDRARPVARRPRSLRHVRARARPGPPRSRGEPFRLRTASTASAAGGTPRRGASRRRSRSAAAARPRSSARACARTRTAELAAPVRGRRPAGRSDVGRLRRKPGRLRLAAADPAREQAMTDERIPFDGYPGLSPLFLEFLRGLRSSFRIRRRPRLSRRARESFSEAPSRVPVAAFRFRSDAGAVRRRGAGRGPRRGVRGGPSGRALHRTALHADEGVRHAARRARDRRAGRRRGAGLLGADRRPRPRGDRADVACPGPRDPRSSSSKAPTAAIAAPSADSRCRRRRGELSTRSATGAKAPDAAEVLAPFARRYAPGATYADAFIETLLDLAAPEPLLVLDPSHESLRAAMTEFFALAVERRAKIEETLAEAAARLERSGRPVPVPHRPDVFPFFLDRRRRAPPRRPIRARRSAKVRAGAAWPSTDVLTRPVLKSFLMPTAAAILGPAEIAYHAQSLPLFPIFGLEPPVLLPRSHLVLVGPAERRAAEALGDRSRGPARSAPAPAATPTARGRRRPGGSAQALDGRLSALAARLQALDPSLSGALETTRQKAAFPLEQLAERIRKAAERKDTTTTNRGASGSQTMLTPSGTTGRAALPAARADARLRARRARADPRGGRRIAPRAPRS